MKLRPTFKAGSSGGPILVVILATLKLAGTTPINSWSWFWITAPVWAPLGLFSLVMLGYFCYRLFTGADKAVIS